MVCLPILRSREGRYQLSLSSKTQIQRLGIAFQLSSCSGPKGRPGCPAFISNPKNIGAVCPLGRLLLNPHGSRASRALVSGATQGFGSHFRVSKVERRNLMTKDVFVGRVSPRGITRRPLTWLTFPSLIRCCGLFFFSHFKK